MSILLPFLAAWAAAAAAMAVLWAVQRRTGDAGVVDVGWAALVGLGAVAFALWSDGWAPRRALVAAAAGLWSLRLSLHIYLDRVRGKPEDGRYRELRARWGARAPSRFFAFFQAQALLAALFAVPALIAAANPRAGWSAWDAAGAAVWLAAVLGERAADRQLARFRADPARRGQVCRAGWWRYSRHPNYFFEWLHWWSYPLLAVGHPQVALTLLAPALMLWFLLKVTGIPATEAHALRSRGEAYRAYQRTTSAFVPWFPRGERS